MKRSISDTLKILCAISLTIITYAEGFCVEPCRFQVGVDMGYNISLHQSQDGEKCDSELQSRTGWVRHLTGLYNIDSRFTTGLGISIDTYRYAPNSVPIFATFRHRAVQKPIWSDFYYFTNLGYGLPFRPRKELAPGWMWDVGIGWQKNFRKHFGINLQIGYSIRQFDTKKWMADDSGGLNFVNSNLVRQSIIASIGIVI